MSDTHRSLVCADGEILRLRSLREGDENGLRSFHDQLSPRSRELFTPHGYDDPLLRNYVSRAQEGEDRSYVLLNSDDAVVGYFFLWNFKGPVPALGIGLADAYQDRKLGRQMMQVLIDDARAAGRDGIELTTVLDNHRAYALYESLGFEYVGNVENVAGDGRVVVERMLFLAFKPGAKPTEGRFRPPVM